MVRFALLLLSALPLARGRGGRHGGRTAVPASWHPHKPAFTLLEQGPAASVAGLSLIGPRNIRRISGPDEERLLRRLESERARHRELAELVAMHDVPKAHWKADDVVTLKRRRLLAKDRIAKLVASLKQLRGTPWQLGHGAYGRVLLGRRFDGGDTLSADGQEPHVAVKVVPHRPGGGGEEAEAAAAEASSLARESLVLGQMTARRETGYPQLLHFGRQAVQGLDSHVLVMELLGPSVEELWWASTGGSGFSAACTLTLGRQMLLRLQQLHAAGWVHNDIKVCPVHPCTRMPDVHV